MNQIVIFHFCFLWIDKHSQLFPGLLGRRGGGVLVVGRMKRGREGGNPSLCRNRARVFLKQALLTSYFHFLQTTCAIVSSHSYPPRATRRGKRRGNLTGSGTSLPDPRHPGCCVGILSCSRGRLLEWTPPTIEVGALM